MIRRSVVLPILVAALGLGAKAGRAEGGPSRRQDVAELMETGWERSHRARAEAERLYERVRTAAPSDHRVTYAYALVQLRQLRYAQAAELLDRVLAADTRDLAAWKTRLWLLVLMKEYDAALARMGEAGEVIPPEKATPGDPDSPQRDLAELLGRIFGFLEGPVREAVDQPRVAQCRREVLARLGGEGQRALEQARGSVLAEFDGRVRHSVRAAEEALAEAETKKRAMLDELQRRQQETAEDVADAEAREAEARERLAYEIARIRGEEQQIAAAMRRVEFQAAAASRELRVIDNRIADLVLAADREEDPDRKQRLMNQAARWQLERGIPLRRLAAAESQAAGLAVQHANLLRQQREAEARYGRQFDTLQTMRSSLDRLESVQGRAEAQAVSGNTAGVRGQRRRSTALTTYVPLPISLEEQRKRLLDSFR